MSDVRPGMMIKSMDLDGNTVFREVTDVFSTVVPENDQVLLTFDNGCKINCSVNHPIMVKRAGEICQVLPANLEFTDRVLTEKGFTRLLTRDVGQCNDPGYIDITVEDTHVFFTADTVSGEMVLTHNSQGGIRNASATVTMPIWHLQFEDFIVLKNNKGTEETRVRHLDYAVMTSSMFWRRFKNKETITLFDPNEVPDLYEAFYSDLKKFEELYHHYEHQKGLRSRVVSAEDLFKSILVERTETGRIYIDFVDNIQRQAPFNSQTHPIYQSNLCLTGDTDIEIMKNGVASTIRLDDFVTEFEAGHLFGQSFDVQVKSCNPATGQVTWSPVSAAACTATVTELIEIEHESGKIIRCTPNHQIYTKNRGWVCAGDLLETDVLHVED